MVTPCYRNAFDSGFQIVLEVLVRIDGIIDHGVKNIRKIQEAHSSN